MSKYPPCPRCKTSKHVKAVGLCGDMFHCTKCGCGFDNDPDEGGDFFADPSRRIELEDDRKRQFNKRR